VVLRGLVLALHPATCEPPALVGSGRGEEEPSGRRWGPVPTRCQRVSAERSLARGGQRGDVLIDGREAGPHGVDAQMRGAGLAPGRDLLIDRR
jgi:hypothetical protein